MNAGAALRVRLALTAPALRTATAPLWEAPGLRERYLDYLQAMHGVIRASVPLMAAAVRRCAELDDPPAEPLSAYLVRHIAEERHHDDWLLEDLEAAGRPRADVLEAPPPPAVARLAGPAYYWVEHHHPVTLLGYIAVLEGNQPPRWLAERLRARTGLPERAFRTVALHAELDAGHSAELDDLLARLPLTRSLERAIGVCALHTVDAFAHLLTTLTAETTVTAENTLRDTRTGDLAGIGARIP